MQLTTNSLWSVMFKPHTVFDPIKGCVERTTVELM